MINQSRSSNRESSSVIATKIAARSSFCNDVMLERKNSGKYLPPLQNASEIFGNVGGRVVQMVRKMERRVPERKPPLAEPENMEEDDVKKPTRRKYKGSMTSSNFLHNFFSSHKKDDDYLKSDLPKVVALTGSTDGDPIIMREKQLARSSTESKLRRTSSHLLSLSLANRLKKRQSEGEITSEPRKNKRLFVGFPDKSCPSEDSELNQSRLRHSFIDFPANNQFKDEKQIALRPLAPRRSDRSIPSLVVQRKVSPGPQSVNDIRPHSAFGAVPLMRSDRRMIMSTPSRPLSRTMTMIESKILPPLYENSTEVPTAENTVKSRRSARRYMGSHTTSTYQGQKDTAPDATPRRHLIGFLHRTSHLSLTSELSGNASFYLIGHRGRRFEDTLGSESDHRLFSDEDDRGSTTTDITSVSRQHDSTYRKRRSRRQYRRPSRASSFSSITESSMSLDVITVTLNMDTVNFLGISIVGESSARGDNGIYVANIMKGGAVALDGRIEAGDMILQVNDISFENFTNDQAVDVLRDAVARKGPIKLTVAKCFENGPKSCFTIPRNHRDEPVRPIDTQAWIQHTNAMRGMPCIMEGSEGAPTPIPGEWQHGRPPSSSTVTSNGSNGQNTIVNGQHKLNIHTDKKKIVEVMSLAGSGLDIKDRTWLKIPIPMSFLGSDLVDWLLEHVDGLRERKNARKFAGDLLKQKLISHVVNQITFIEQRYYVLGPECSDFARYRSHPEDLQTVHQQHQTVGRWQWTTGPSSKTGQTPSMHFRTT
ncbi:unnamed protein product [Auanema sp. JU1783]|nr:unnamed protein product [Auanema sp. JU1783]